MKRTAWQLVEPEKPLQQVEDEVRAPARGEVTVEVAGCGLCHTDISFLTGQVKTRQPLPLVLGHEVAGKVVACGEGAEGWQDASVVVAAVIPCGDCALCRSGRGNVCQKQQMPGNDCDGGFASHITIPAYGLARIESLPAGHEVADFSVIADAVSTSLQAVERAGVGTDDFVIVIGAGGVGGFAAQICAARGARVVAVDVADDRLEPLAAHGAHATVNCRELDARALRDQVRGIAKEAGAPRTGWKIFECSGTAAGQESAYGLLGPAGTIAVVGFTMEKVKLRLSNLMAFDATAFGSWGCPMELYPEAISLISSGQVAVKPFVRHVPMAEIGSVIEAAGAHADPRRAILIP